MTQPIWKLVFATDYSALYTDETGVYEPELVIAQEIDDENTFEVFRFSCDQLVNLTVSTVPEDESVARDAEISGDIERASLIRAANATTVLVTRHIAESYLEGTLPHPITSYGEWFADSLASVAATCDHASIVEDLCSDDIATRARAYESIGGHHGYNNLDHKPDTWTEAEMSTWPERGPAIDEDDFISGYIECALWCGVISPDEEACENMSGMEGEDHLLTDAARAEIEADCRSFIAGNGRLLALYVIAGRTASDAGHDFYLTRNGHGAGFWDRGLPGSLGDDLTRASKPYGSQSLQAEWDPADCEIEDEDHEDYLAPDDRNVIALHVCG